jgi:hypothetical protein
MRKFSLMVCQLGFGAANGPNSGIPDRRSSLVAQRLPMSHDVLIRARLARNDLRGNWFRLLPATRPASRGTGEGSPSLISQNATSRARTPLVPYRIAGA